ncbi:MAG: sigma-E processing peptidase SpoIIGA, partial [Clostridia bacterium]|nr:sigma-E processing peptidase SpoIIGA [Clostridia bacterium]
MVVYLDSLIINNFFMDAWIAYLVRKFLRGKGNFWRVILSSVIGTALVFPFLYIKPIWLSILYKIGTLVLCCAPLGQGWHGYLKSLVLYALASAVIGGLSYLVADATPWGGIALTSSGLLVGLISGAGLLATFLFWQAAGLVKERRRRSNLRRVVLVDGEARHELTAYLDSGNTITDARGEGVLVLSSNLADLLRNKSPSDHLALST